MPIADSSALIILLRKINLTYREYATALLPAVAGSVRQYCWHCSEWAGNYR